MPGGVAPKFGSEKVSCYTGVSQLQLRVSRYNVQLSGDPSARVSSRKQRSFEVPGKGGFQEQGAVEEEQKSLTKEKGRAKSGQEKPS